MSKRSLSSRAVSRKTRINILLSTIQDESYLDVALTACSLVDINKELLLAKIFTASFDESDTRSFQKKIASIAMGLFNEDKNIRLKSRPYTLISSSSSSSPSTQTSTDTTLLSDEGDDEPDAKRKCKRSLVLSDSEDQLPLVLDTNNIQVPLVLDDDTDDEDAVFASSNIEDHAGQPSLDHIWCEQCEAWKPGDNFSPEKQGIWLTRQHRKPSDEIFCLDHQLQSHFAKCLLTKINSNSTQDISIRLGEKKVNSNQVEEKKVNSNQVEEKKAEQVEVGRDVYSFGAGSTLCINGMAIGRYYRDYNPAVVKRYMDEFRRTHSFGREDLLEMLPVGTDASKFTEMEVDRLRHFVIDAIVTRS